MNEILEAMIDLQRQQIALGERVLNAGRDLVAAQERTVAATKAGGEAWAGWLKLWVWKP